MIISIMLFEFQYSAMVERKLAYNDLNQLQAYYLAKSGARIGLLRVCLYGRVKKNKDLKSLESQGIPVSSLIDQIWSLPLPPFPPDVGKIKQLDKADKDAAEKVLDQTRVEEGESTHVITTEGSKINLNYLRVPPEKRNDRINFPEQPTTLWEFVGRFLITLIQNMIRDSENPNEEFGPLRPEDVALAIMDWVTPGDNSFLGGTKDSFYEQQKPPYKAKRNYFYTLDEVKLVRDIDDNLFTKLKPHITVYSRDGKINLNSASDKMIRALYRDFTEDDIKKISEEKARVGGQWVSEKQFVDYVSGTLGRSGFKTMYSDEKNYPFTVASQSFLIESIGAIRRSASTIQKVIRVGVALTGSAGGTVDTTVQNEADCAKKGGAWIVAQNRCYSRPTTQEQCVNNLVGTWQKENGRDCCKYPRDFNDYRTICIDPNAKSQGADANAVKVLYWSES